MATIPPAEHERTVAHMNKDHAEDLTLYLRHKNKLSEADAADAELVSLDLTKMVIRSASGTHTVALKPPMRSWADRRGRLIDMTVDARAALTAPDPVLGGSSAESFRMPALVPDAATAGAVAFYFVSLAAVRGGQVVPGSAAWDLLGRVRFPGGPAFFCTLVDVLAPVVLLIHVVEAWTMHRTRMVRYGVPTGSSAWFLWVVATFFEGICAFKRFDRFVREKKREAVLEKQGKDH